MHDSVGTSAYQVAPPGAGGVPHAISEAGIGRSPSPLRLLQHEPPHVHPGDLVNPQGGHMGRNVAISDQKIFETVTLPWVVRLLR